MTKHTLLAALLLAVPVSAFADYLVPVRPIRSHTVLSAEDLELRPGDKPGALFSKEEAVGLETRVNLYPGKAILFDSLGPPAVIERNAVVTMRYQKGVLSIVTEGRALARAGVGERVRVMNLDSRMLVSGTVIAPGVVQVRQ